MRKRLAFKCWNCKRTYTLLKEITAEQELIVPCPFCDMEAVVKLEPYKKGKKVVIRGDGEEEPTVAYEYDFPDVIPTQRPEQK